MKFFIFFIFLKSLLLASFEPYFQFSQADIRKIDSETDQKLSITFEEVQKWDFLVEEISRNTTLEDCGNQRFFAYLYVGQRDFFLLTKGKGSIAPITKKITMLFFPEQVFSMEVVDPFSEEVANLVFQKIQNRYLDEQCQLYAYPLKAGVQYWTATPPIVGQRVGSCKTWLIGPVKAFRLSDLPSYKSLIWDYGIFEILKIQKNISEQDLIEIHYWADMADWNKLCSETLKNKKRVSLADFMYIRSNFAMTLVDAMISCFDNKYTYLVLRPHMKDPRVKLLIPCPKHPSYPSGHSTLSSAAATTLAFYFPEDRHEWLNEAFKAGNSRIAAGLHYTLDNQDGLMLGERVANRALDIISRRR